MTEEQIKDLDAFAKDYSKRVYHPLPGETPFFTEMCQAGIADNFKQGWLHCYNNYLRASSSQPNDLDELKAEIEYLTERLNSIIYKVNTQSKDEGIWFLTTSASEEYLQQALRELHRVIERPMIKKTS